MEYELVHQFQNVSLLQVLHFFEDVGYIVPDLVELTHWYLAESGEYVM